MKVYEAMTKNPVTLSLDSTVFESCEIMISKNIGSVIVTEEGELMGIITMRDILARVIAKDKNPKTTKLRDVMSKPVISIQENADLIDASRLGRKNNIRRLAVLNKKGKLVGIISSDDIASSLQRAAEELAVTYYLISARSRQHS